MIPPFNPNRPPMESAKRSIEVDMSPEAIEGRLRELGQLYEFWKSLRTCGNMGPIEAQPPRVTDAKEA